MTVGSFYVMRMYHWSICFPLSSFVSFFILFFLSFFLSLWIRLFISQFFIKHSKNKILTYIITLERSEEKINATVYPPTSELTTLLIWIFLPVLKIQSLDPLFLSNLGKVTSFRLWRQTKYQYRSFEKWGLPCKKKVKI